MRLLFLSLAVLLGSAAAQHQFSQPLDPPHNQLLHSEVDLHAVEDRPFSQHRSVSPLHSKVVFGARLDPRPPQKAGTHFQSHRASTISEISNRKTLSEGSRQRVDIDSQRFKIEPFNAVPVLSRQLEPPMMTEMEIRPTFGSQTSGRKTKFSERTTSQNKFNTRTEAISPKPTFASQTSDRKTNFSERITSHNKFTTRTGDVSPRPKFGSQTSGSKTTFSEATTGQNKVTTRTGDVSPRPTFGSQTSGRKTKFSERSTNQNQVTTRTDDVLPNQTPHSFFDIFWATGDKKKITSFHKRTKHEQNVQNASHMSQSSLSDRNEDASSSSSSSSSSSIDFSHEASSDGRLENHFEHSFREQSSPNFDQQKTFKQVISFSSHTELPRVVSDRRKTVSDSRRTSFTNLNTDSELLASILSSRFVPTNVNHNSQSVRYVSPSHQVEIAETYLPPHATLKPKIVQNYLPPLATPESTIEQTYLPPSTTAKPKSVKNYLHPLATPEPEIEQTYLPPSTTAKPKLVQIYLPPLATPEPKIEDTYLPPSTTPNPKIVQNYLPPLATPDPKIEQTYLPPSTTPKPKLVKNYLPPLATPDPKIEHTYLLPSTTPNPKIVQNYLPPLATPDPKIEQTYLPPSTTPKLKIVPNYLPPLATPEPKIEQTYIPPSTTVKPKRVQNYLPPLATPEPKIEQTYLPPSTTIKPKIVQNYLPPLVTPEPQIEQTYLPLSTTLKPKLVQNYLPPSTTPAPKSPIRYLAPSAPRVVQNYISPSTTSASKLSQNYSPPSTTSAPRISQNYLPPDSEDRKILKQNQASLYRPRIMPGHVSILDVDGDSRESSFSAFIPVIAVIGDERRTVEVPISALRGKKDSLEVSSYSDYTRSDLTVQRLPFSVTAVTDEFEDEPPIVPQRGTNTQQSLFLSTGGHTFRRQPYTVVSQLDRHSSVTSTNRLRGHSECSSNRNCKDSELCSDGNCVNACLLARGRCVGQSTCATRRHTAACVCPESFTSVILRQSGGDTRYDCKPMETMTPPRVSHRKVFGSSSSGSRLSSSYSNLLPTRHSSDSRIASGPIRGPVRSSSGIGLRSDSSSSSDPCRPSPCGPNTRCDVNARGIAQCKCLDNFVPDGHTINGCKPQCVSDFECPDDYRCRQTKCERVCVPGACGLNADCDGRNHRALCTCPNGFDGNADVSCAKIIVKLRAAAPAPPADPCFPSPCGRDAECKEREGRAVCSCPYGYEGDPLDFNQGCSRAECLQSSDCDRSKACQGQKCINPCDIPDICARTAECTVREHQPVCSCAKGYTGDPFQICSRFNPQELCDPSPCAANTNCRVQNDRAVCSCIENYIGDPLDRGCRAECISDRDCPGDRTCRENRCSNPCAYSACGEGAYCDVSNNRVTCTCPEFFQGNAHDRCFAECTAHDDCRSHEACFQLKCVDPCVGACGTGADCKVEDHKPICSCPRGYTGHPFESCRPFTKADLCNPNPCGSEADCTPGTDRSGEDRPVCTCPIGYIGNPLVACERGQCQRPEDCGADETCHAYHCQSPCVTDTGSVCGELADCIVRNHQPVCSCPPGYEGNPLKECFTGSASSRFHAGRT